MITNKELASQARDALQGRWGIAILGLIVFYIIVGGANVFIDKQKILLIPVFFIMPALMLGFVKFIMSISRNQEVKIETIFSGFNSFIQAFLTYLITAIFVFLWALLLIVPGVIASLSYSMVFFIIADGPTIKPMDAIKKSKEMMNGYKLKFLLLNLRFIGWVLLGVLTLGIGLLWVFPYMYVTMVKFYDDINTDSPRLEEQKHHEFYVD